MRISDEVFWKNYFYHVEYIKLQYDLKNKLKYDNNDVNNLEKNI